MSTATYPARYPAGGPAVRVLAGLGSTARLVLRRDRVLLAVWVAGLTLLTNSLVSATAAAYPTGQVRAAFAAASGANPAQLALRGPVFSPTVGGLVAWTIASSGVLLMGLVSLLLVIRHTRVEEQTGRRELLGSTVVSRHTPLAAALLVVLAGDLAVGVLTALGLIAQGLPMTGSFMLGLALGAGGAVFAGVGALAAQIAESAGLARGIAIAVLGVFFALAAVGDLTRSGLVWASPFGWARHAQAFAGERWWVFALFVGLTAALVAAGQVLSSRRDIGAGLVAPRLGPATAAPSLRSSLALAWRRHRSALAGWTVGLTALGALFGAAASTLDTQLDTPAFHQLAASLGATSPAQAFFQMVLYLLAQVVAAFAIATTLRMRGDEVSGLAAPVLVTPVGRLRWAAGHVGIAVVGVAVVLAGLGLGAGLTYGLMHGDSVGQTLRPFAIMLSYLPACLVLTGLAVALFGWVPRLAAPVTWTVLALVVLVDLLGEFRLVTGPVLNVSPFQYTLRALTGSPAAATPLIVLVAIAATLIVAGLAGFRRRDIA